MALAPTPLQLEYIDPDGNDWDLSDMTLSKGYACSAYAGIDGLPVTLQTTPLLDGTAYTNFWLPQPGTIILAVFVTRPASDDENDYYRLLDRIVRAFYTRRNEAPAAGTLIVQRPDGSTRQVSVFTTSGLNNPEVGINGILYTITLQTPDPFWYDQSADSLTFAISSAAGILPLLPIGLSSGSVLGAASVLNEGSAYTFPVWTLTGPGTPTMQNLTTGRSWALTSAVPAGHVVEVVTQPGRQSVVDTTTSANLWDSLSITSPRDLWALVPGINNINIAMAGSTPATKVGISWRARWLRA